MIIVFFGIPKICAQPVAEVPILSVPDGLSIKTSTANQLAALLFRIWLQGMQVVIPPKKNGIEKRSYDSYLYKLRHLVENAFLHLKAWRGVATRYAKKTSSYLAVFQIRCIFLWATIS